LYFCTVSETAGGNRRLRRGIGFLETLFPTLGAGALAAIPIWFYNGKRGKQQMKFLFYWFYPLHLLILFLIRWYFLGIPLE
jgi:hypothetical protein